MEVKIYTTPTCVQCEMTKKQMTRFGIQYTTIDLSQNPEAKAEIDPLGYTQAPVVVAGKHSWSGFKLEHIRDLAQVIKAEERIAS